MSSRRENFDSWYVSHINELKRHSTAGFVLLLISFPLLERYLSLKARQRERNARVTHPKFLRELRIAFPEIKESRAETFWNCYRNGLLHGIAMKTEGYGLRSEGPAVEVEGSGRIWINPRAFAEKVVSIIEGDFQVFEGELAPDIWPIPEVAAFYLTPNMSAYDGTLAIRSSDTKGQGG
jgi:hypothetical protein